VQEVSFSMSSRLCIHQHVAEIISAIKLMQKPLQDTSKLYVCRCKNIVWARLGREATGTNVDVATTTNAGSPGYAADQRAIAAPKTGAMSGGLIAVGGEPAGW